ncbi:MAG: 2-C-methyl-D-erythritol 4-phosphate cytidylyltransferase [Candidatus Izemoplasmatales bacterium]|jgi:2-C-methyl-D-erythritol 4-phosphate cytidylyltransferase|nr:2-C-methyl-D-erythritol 4-phosphate cytidylyltransferase [Candidatus Izemoplasmatales bacterium]MDD3865512.1 2-C-methyl-D-erythritol 4-phosphate cytidylyltransferase [Candidatus Izemoplasmatales bacterium]
MYTALIVAAGSGSRTKLPFNKMFYEIKKKPLIMYSVDRFLADSDCEEVVIVHANVDASRMTTLTKNMVKIKLTVGGTTRQGSVYAGLKLAKSKYVLIHDGARPNISKASIDNLKRAMLDQGAATLAIPIKDSLVTVENNFVTEFINRDTTYLVQTPQAFLTEDILKAHLLANNSGTVHTDDVSVYLDKFNKEVKIVLGDEDNIKVTTKTDLQLMEALL